MIGATVQIKGTNTGTVVRDKDGNFSIQVPNNSSKILVVKMIGKKTQEINMSEKSSVSITLKDDIRQTDAVVVTAIGVEKERRSLGYSTQELDGNALSQGRPRDILGALQAQVAGVQINQSSGSPGAASYIRIRGVNSLTGGNQPIFVIDGVVVDNSYMGSATTNPTETSNNANLASVDQGSRISDINPDDIESVQVLKGAAATALYGLNASAGAIIIRTKKGNRDGSVKVAYTYTMGMSEVNKLPELQTKYSQGSAGSYNGPQTNRSQSWGAMIDTLRYDGATNYIFDKKGNIVGKSTAPNGSAVTAYDNLKDFFQTGSTKSHSLSLTAGSSTASYLMSFSDSRETGVVPLSGFDRTSIRLNTDYSLYSNFRVSTTAQYSRSGGNRIQKGSNTSGVMLGLLRTPITFDNSNGFGAGAVDDPTAYTRADGSTPRAYRGNNIYDNPYWTVNRNTYEDRTERFIGSLQFDYLADEWFGRSILGELRSTLRMGGDFYNTRNHLAVSIKSATLPTGRVTDDDIRNQQLNSELLFNFSQDLSEKAKLNLLVGTQLFESFNRQFISQGDGLTIPNFYNQSNATSWSVFETQGILRRLGTFFSGSLDWDNSMYLSLGLRNEMSTTLPVDNNSFLMYNIGLAAVLDKYLGLTEDGFLNFAKIRFSFSKTGSDAPIYALTTPFTRTSFGDGWRDTQNNYPMNGVPGFQKSAVLGNNTIKPESRKEIEIGAELHLFENRIGLDITYYSTTNTDQIIQTPIATTSGFAERLVNAGEMRSSGIEAVLNVGIIKTDDMNLDWRVNFSTFNNEVISLADGVTNIFLGGFEGGSVRAVVGLPYGSIFGQAWKRNSDGKILVGDDGIPMTADTESAFGSNIPDWIIGSTLSFGYSGVNVGATFEVRQGGTVWNGTRAALNFFGRSKESENRENINGTYGGITFVNGVIDGVRDSDGKANATAITGQQFWGNFGTYNNFNTLLIEPFAEDASWFRIREVTLSYDFSKSLTESIGLFQAIQVFASGRNLFLSTKYTGVDPETNLTGAMNAQGIDYFNMPGIQSYNFGVKVGL